MKWFGALGCLVMVLFISSACMLAASGAWGPLAAQMAVGAGGLTVYLRVQLRRERQRLGTLAGILAACYDSGQDTVSISMIEPVIDDEGLLRARSSWIVRRDTALAQRYANGDSSDY